MCERLPVGLPGSGAAGGCHDGWPEISGGTAPVFITEAAAGAKVMPPVRWPAEGYSSSYFWARRSAARAAEFW